jgi:hypothetical protein
LEFGLKSNQDDGTVWYQGTGWSGAGSVSNYYIQDGDSGPVRLSIDSSGNLGIGTTSPQESLHVYNNGVGGTSRIELESTSDTGVSAIEFTNEGGQAQGTSQIGVAGSNFGNINLSNRLYLYGRNASGISLISGASTPKDIQFLTHLTASGPSMVLATSGNIGIGTTSPGARLDIKASTNDGSTNVLNWQDSDGTALGVIDSDGNIGIGTTEPGQKLSIGSTDASDQIGIYHDNANAHITWDDGTLKLETNEGTDTNTQVQIQGKGTGLGQLLIYDQDNAENLSLYSSSGVGVINTSGVSPSNLSFQTTAHAGITMFQYASEGETQELDINGYRTGDALRTLEIGVGVDAVDTASFDGVSNYYFDGNVGIGTTSPGAKLEIRGIARAYGSASYYVDIYGGATEGVLSSNGNISFRPGAISRAGVDSAGLYVTNGLKFRDANSYLQLYEGGTGNIKLWNYYNTDMLFGTNNIERMRIDNTGNIGIGTTEPNYKLEVSGAIMLEDMTAPSSSTGHSGIYSNGGELFTLDALGNANQISPHDENNNWFFNSENINTGETLRVEMEKLTKELDQLLGGGYVFENGERYTQLNDQIQTISNYPNQIESINEILRQAQDDIGMIQDTAEELAELTLTVEGLNETDTMIIGKLSDHENEIALLKADLLNVKTQIDPNYSNEIQMSNDLISSYSSLEDLGNLLASNEDEEGDTIFTLTADLELVNLKAERGEFEEIESEKANFEDVTVAGINVGENSSGKAVIMPGEKEVVIESALVKENSIIHLTLTSKKNGQDIYIKEIIEEENFVVEIEEGEALKKLEFNWLIIN